MMSVVRGVLAAATMLAFVALVVRVWNRKYLPEFDSMARLALDEEQSRTGQGEGEHP